MDPASGCPNIVDPDVKRSKRTEWEHVVPAHRMGGHLTCWTDGLPECTKKGKPYKGRKCCEAFHPGFRAAHNDPHNLFPANGRVNGDRSNHPFGEVSGEPRKYGSCDFEVGGSPKRAEYSAAVKGEVARTILYMVEKHGIQVPYDLDELRKQSAEDPPEAWEIDRARAIQRETGLNNLAITQKK